MISFLSVLSDIVINCSNCTASVIDILVISNDGMILTVGWGWGWGWVGGVGVDGGRTARREICPSGKLSDKSPT